MHYTYEKRRAPMRFLKTWQASVFDGGGPRAIIFERKNVTSPSVSKRNRLPNKQCIYRTQWSDDNFCTKQKCAAPCTYRESASRATLQKSKTLSF